MKNMDIRMGTLPQPFNDGKAQSITFCVTEECNLRCKYCYMTEKNSYHRMTLDTAKKAVDYFLKQEPTEPAVIWEFIGGEPTLEMELIDQISDYIKYRMYVTDHPWFNNYVFSICTNGLLYHTEPVQNYIAKNRTHVNISITIDGIKEKHDLQRVFADGTGSYDAVIKNIPLWTKQFPGVTTKVTFASDDLVYLKDSIIHLWNLGLKTIPANVVFEDVWKEGDEVIFESQLRDLADYIIEHELWRDYSVRFFDPTVGFPLGQRAKRHNFCGTGKMIAVDSEGLLYPCVRFVDFCNSSQDTKSPYITGNIQAGSDEKRREIVRSATVGILNDGDCAECAVASGCFSCTACNYNYSKTGSVFIRTKFHCLLQKAQVRANEYFWDRLSQCINDVTPRELERMKAYDSDGWRLDGGKYLYFIMSDNFTSHCMYFSDSKSLDIMPKDVFRSGLEYAHKNSMIPVFLGDPGTLLPAHETRKLHLLIAKPDEEYIPKSAVEKYIPVLDMSNYEIRTAAEICIFMINQEDILKLETVLLNLSEQYARINIIKEALEDWTQESVATYQTVLEKIYNNRVLRGTSINLFDNGTLPDDCGAGISDFTLAPDGRFYICPGYYFGNSQAIGDLYTGINDEELVVLKRDKSPQCKICLINSCNRCSLNSMQKTKMMNLPSTIFCEIANIENKFRGNKT